MQTPDRVLASPLSFKAKLQIGENAYGSLIATKNLQSAWDLFGVGSSAAGLAKTTWLASMIGTKIGPLAFLGLGNPVTAPLLVAAIAIGSTAVYFGATRRWKKFSDDRVVTIPKFLNTPLDLLAANMLDLMALLAFKVSSADGQITVDEIETIEDYFVSEWGFDPIYLQSALSQISDSIDHLSVEDIVMPLRAFVDDNKDCNADAICRDLLSFLDEVVCADGEVSPAEQVCISEIAQVLCKKSLADHAVNRVTSLFNRK